MEELDLFLVYDAIVWQYHYSNICVYFDNHARYETKQLQIPRKNEWDNQRSFQKGAAEYFGLIFSSCKQAAAENSFVPIFSPQKKFSEGAQPLTIREKDNVGLCAEIISRLFVMNA